MANKDHQFIWNFQRLGGIDQATLHSREELEHIRELDPKLWATLSCPASGLEFDARTLTLVDTDGDGRIRIPEVMEAVEFVCAHLTDPAAIVTPEESMPLSLLRNDTPECTRMHGTAHAILENLGKPEATSLTFADVEEAAEKAAENEFNGDGIIAVREDTQDEAMQQYIKDAMSVMGAVDDASGLPGINKEISEAFIATLEAKKAWEDGVSCASTPLGQYTDEAWGLYQTLKNKIDDYFLRCDLAAFAPVSTECVSVNNVTDTSVTASEGNEHGLLDMGPLASLPISRVEADRALHLSAGINPAWKDRLLRFVYLVGPLLEDKEALTHEAWLKVQESFTPYAEALTKKPKPVAVEVTVPPTGVLDDITDERMAEILGSDIAQRFAALSDKDLSVPAASEDIALVERLVLYYLNLHRLLMNFVSFYDFYSLSHSAAFQSGTLYIDGRSCHLCLPVADIAKHSTLAAYSQLCLLYCECRRITEPDSPDAGQTINIVAAMTAGDADLLMEGRNGIFVDTKGRDWDATLVKLISNPISIRQALWQPYKRIGKLITDQIAKYADSKQKSLTDTAAKQLDTASAAMSTGKVTAPQFDIGKSVGIFAAVGLALGAIGTAVASIASALLSLHWWQFPLVFIGLFALISGPSFVLAWLKLRKRTLGPLLEASGWAVNSRVPINLTLGKALTSTAQLPHNISRCFVDPLMQKDHKPLIITLIIAIVFGCIGALAWFHKDELNQWMTESGVVEAPAPAKKK